MADIKEWKTINTGSISAGGTVEKDWSPDVDKTVEKITVSERDNLSTAKVDCYITIADEPKTKPDIPLKILDLDYANAPVLNWTLAKGVKIYFKITNNEAAARNLDIILWLV